MKVFVINLDKNKERLDLIDAQLRNIGVGYERIKAVYGKELAKEEKQRSVNKSAFWCLRGYPIRDGEIGCALSHLNVYRRMVAENVPVACVLEDDADPHAELPTLLKWLERHVEVARSQCILISNHGNRDSDELGMYPIRSATFTDGYVITRTAAEVLLKKNFPIKGPSDSWTFWRSRRWIELFQATPAGCNQRWQDEGYTSDVTPDCSIVADVSRMTRVQLYAWKLKRLVGIVLARILYW